MIDPKTLSKLIRDRKKKMRTPEAEAKQMNASDDYDATQEARVKARVGFEALPPEKRGPQPTEMSDEEYTTMGSKGSTVDLQAEQRSEEKDMKEGTLKPTRKQRLRKYIASLM